MKSKIPAYFIVESWLHMYPSWKAEMDELNSKLQHISGVTQQDEPLPFYAKGQRRETVLDQVIERFQIQEFELPLLAMRIDLLDMAMLVLTPEEQMVVKLKYWQRLANPTIMNQLAWSERTFYIKRKRILEKLYHGLGGEDALFGLSHRSLRSVFPQAGDEK